MEHAPSLDPLDAALKRELTPHEIILWQGRPLRRISMLSFGIYLFAVPWTCFALFWMVMAFAGSQSFADGGWSWTALAFPLFGLPFVAVGLAMLSAPFLPLYSAKRTLFAITDARLIKLTLGRSLTAETVPANRIGLTKRNERSDASGSLKIAIKVGVDSDGDRSVETFNIGEVSKIFEVEHAVRDLQSRAAKRANLSVSSQT